jgi:TolB-like protein/DNA-binding winged helix-turn-helix (wHTH) protein/Tfp pilus assembly protein PilF
VTVATVRRADWGVLKGGCKNPENVVKLSWLIRVSVWPMASSDGEPFGFEGFTLDLTRGCLLGGAGEIELRPKSFELLRYLVENAGRLIPKDELVDAVWPNVIVSDDSLAQCVSELRQALKDQDRHIIRTVPRRGYLFAAPVSLPARNSAIRLPDACPAEGADQNHSVRQALPIEPAVPRQQGRVTATRRLAAILAADVVGYSRLIGADESGTLDGFKAIRAELFDPATAAHNGRLVKTTGDGLLVEFASVVNALRCASQFQRSMAERNRSLPAEKRIEFRIGIHQGDVLVEDGDIFGDGVNVAVRLEGLAEPGGICVSARVQEDAAGKLDLNFEDLGDQQLKNILRPMRTYRLLAGGVRRSTSPPAIAVPRLSIVVLPFANLSNDPEQEYFTDGITDDLTTDLSRISGSFVIARSTAFTYKGKPVDVKEVGRELGVRYVLEGSVRRRGDRVRFNVQLLDAVTGSHVWADRFDTDRANLQNAEEAVVGRLAHTLNLKLVEAAAGQVDEDGTADPDASELVMRGRAWLYRPYSAATLQQAQQAFERALAIDPKSIGAKLGIAEVLVKNIAEGGSKSLKDDEARAEQLLTEVLARDTNRSDVHLMMGLLRRIQSRLAESRMEFETGIALGHNNAWGIRQLGQTLIHEGEPEAAIPYYEKAIQLSPLDPNIAHAYWGLGRCHLLLGRADQAIHCLRKARAANPRVAVIHLHLAAALALKGALGDAQAALAEALALQPEFYSSASLRGIFPDYRHPPRYLMLLEDTIHRGLRRVGFAVPDDFPSRLKES